MRITSKLGLLVAVPLVAVLAFAALAVSITGGEAVRAEALRRLVAVGADAGELAHQLQLERAGALLVLTGGSPQEGGTEFVERVAATQRAAQAYRVSQADLTSAPAGTATLLDRVDAQLARLDRVREQVTSDRGAGSTVAFAYRILIADLIGLRESTAQGAPAEVADRLRAAAALSQAAEAVGRAQVAVLRAAEFGSLTPAAAQELTAARGAHTEALLTFDALATPAWRAALERSVTGGEPLAAKRLEDEVARTPAGGRLQVSEPEWTAALDGRMQRLRQVETQVDADIVDEVGGLRDAQRRATVGQVTAVLVAVAAAIALAVALGRPVIRGLRRLRDAAHLVAHQELPGAVAQLEMQEELGGLTPEEFADRAPRPVAVRGRDELAEVGAAFNTVHREAVRTAAGQVMLRVRIGEMFVNLARRGQTLTGQLASALDDLERHEEDPQRLRQLFQVDLLATLLSRANDSLLVLGGAASSRVPPEADRPMADVLKAAAGRVRHYQRVELGMVDDGVALRAAAVDDVVQLLAELIDNATAFSEPSTPVVVSAHWLRDRVLVQVVDQGVGILPPERREEFNRRLASRPPLDLQAVKSMGLTVVSRLAERYGIRVELRVAQPRGTTAEVTLPADLVGAGRFGLAGVAAGGQVAVAGRHSRTGQVAAAAAGPGMSWPPVPATPGQAIPATPGQAIPAASGRALTGPAAPTQELPLPIFDSVRRSLWFTPSGETAAQPNRHPAGVGTEPPATSWRTGADAGWQAAAAATEPVPAGVTTSGLPVRRRGAQLVPGGVGPVLAMTGASGTGPGGHSDSGQPAGAVPGGQFLPDPVRVSAAAAAFSRGLATGRARPAASRAAGPAATIDGNGDAGS